MLRENSVSSCDYMYVCMYVCIYSKKGAHILVPLYAGDKKSAVCTARCLFATKFCPSRASDMP